MSDSLIPSLAQIQNLRDTCREQVGQEHAVAGKTKVLFAEIKQITKWVFCLLFFKQTVPVTKSKIKKKALKIKNIKGWPTV